jgi:hypothetical protein
MILNSALIEEVNPLNLRILSSENDISFSFPMYFLRFLITFLFIYLSCFSRILSRSVALDARIAKTIAIIARMLRKTMIRIW